MKLEILLDKQKKPWDIPVSSPSQRSTIISSIYGQGKRIPKNSAILDGELTITYEQLIARASIVANTLAVQGVKRGALVAVCMERSWELVATLIGILRAGCAYVPLDPSYPQARIQYMLAHSCAVAAIVDSETTSALCSTVDKLINMTEVTEVTEQPLCDFEGPSSNELAYVMYTSGSTGQPKGVMVSHGNLVALSDAMAQLFSQEELSGVLAAASVCFDTSVMEVLGTLSLGGTIILAPNAVSLPTLVHANKVKMCVMVPSSMQALLATNTLPDNIQCVVFGGEALKLSLVKQIHALAHCPRVLNAYGPTEDTVFSTISAVERGTSCVTIGKSVTNSRAYILNESMTVTSAGEPGELYLAGNKLAGGYLNDEALTRERFIDVTPTTAIPEQRLYRTGDLCQWHSNGEIDYVGRIDQQVKLRGFRIELGEIESTLEEMAGIDAAAAAVLDSGTGKKVLVVYVVSQSSALTSLEITEYLSMHLPKYMLPQLVMHLESLPFLPNDKLDRSQLPQLAEVRLAVHKEQALESETSIPRENIIQSHGKYGYEEVLAVIQHEVASLLNLTSPQDVQEDVTFNRFGFDSLSSLEFTSRLSAQLNYKLADTLLFEQGTPKALAGYLVKCLSGTGSDVSALGQPPLESKLADTLAHFQTLLQCSHPTFQSASAVSWSVTDKSILVKYITEMVNNNGRNPYGKVLRTGSAATGVIGDSYKKGGDRNAIIWSTNLYFGLNRDANIIAQASKALQQYGTGMGISAAATGMTDLHVAFEQEFAQLVGKQSACLFPTGYTANLGAISGIVSNNDIVVIDQLCHASIVDGARLSGAQIRTFKHNDMQDLEAVLSSAMSPYHTTLVVLESVYSMGEGIAPVADIVKIAKQYGALTLVDEAHSFGFYGDNGAGVCALQGATDNVDFLMTTLSKAMGSIGGVIAASDAHIELLKSASRAYIFQASISPADIAAALASLRYLRSDNSLRAQLWDRTTYMRQRFTQAGYDLGDGDGPIVTPHFSDKETLYAIVQGLYDRGVQTLAVTYPIVEMGRGRLRFICSASHTRDDIDRTLQALIETEQAVKDEMATRKVVTEISAEPHLASKLVTAKVQRWAKQFAAGLNGYLISLSGPAPELMISVEVGEGERSICVMLKNREVTVHNELKMLENLPSCTLQLANNAALNHLCTHDIEALLNNVCMGTCLLAGQTEVFVWLIARMDEQKVLVAQSETNEQELGLI
ncbi:hypothetical protein PCIT_b1003 [Pseudoalteromonas citrea]|uniref:Carrier domain-containing protein n=2 Tax=Pseudoalteromonas citrea TaxID=43655 RepID=A0AAD4AFA3_9GAMM|nr:amino acid adenylation domain-containing protein [Pseudoalteromonas citrea]KAF7764904.1 hypothetical protein PCIT_b1003 [Pseudoalteromonas citrea]